MCDELEKRQKFDASKRPPVDISDEDIERAFKNAENCRKLMARGKTPEEIFDLLLKLTD